MDKGTKRVTIMFSLMGALFLTLPIALGFKFYYAFHNLEGPIDDKYYEIGLHFDQYKKEMQNSKDRLLLAEWSEGINAGLAQGSNQLTVHYFSIPESESARIKDVDVQSGKLKMQSVVQKTALQGAKVIMHISRSSTITQDKDFECTTDVNGSCKVPVEFKKKGVWELTLSATDPSGKYRIMRRVDIP